MRDPLFTPDEMRRGVATGAESNRRRMARGEYVPPAQAERLRRQERFNAGQCTQDEFVGHVISALLDDKMPTPKMRAKIEALIKCRNDIDPLRRVTLVNVLRAVAKRFDELRSDCHEQRRNAPQPNARRHRGRAWRSYQAPDH